MAILVSQVHNPCIKILQFLPGLIAYYETTVPTATLTAHIKDLEQSQKWRESQWKVDSPAPIFNMSDSSSFSWCFSNNSFISLPFTSVNLPMLLFLAIPLYLVNSTYHAHFFLDYSRKSSLITLPYHRSDLLVNGLNTSELYLHNCDHSSYIFICIIVYV